MSPPFAYSLLRVAVGPVSGPDSVVLSLFGVAQG